MRQRRESTEIIVAVREELRFAVRIVLCAIYVCWWRTKHYVRYDPKLNRGAKVAAAGSALVLFLDLLLFFLHRDLALWLGKFAIVVLVPTAAVLFLHRFAETKRRDKESSFAKRIVPVVDLLREVASSDKKEEALENFVSKLLNQVYEDFAARKPTNVNVMFPCGDGKLRILYLFPPGTKYDPEVSFEPGEGGSGYSYKETKTIYIPAITYRHGIIIALPEVSDESGKIQYGLKRRLYVPISEEYEIYESILSMPVTSPVGTHAVLNLDSEFPDAFDSQDIYTLAAYARILGDGFSLCAQ